MRVSTAQTARWLMTLVFVFAFASTAVAQRNVTLQLNTATLPDTTNTESLIQVRGALQADDASTLPDGNMITWGDDTTLEATNDGGDFWSISFQIPDDTELRYKFFSDQAENVSEIGGWEDGISDGTDGNAVIAAGTGDTTLTLHYFNKGGDQEYAWRPFESKMDSVAVWYRIYVNTEDALNGGLDLSMGAADSVGVRGDDFTMTGPLDWGTTLVLSPEVDEDNKPGQFMYSGVAYYPASLIGMTQNYKFVWEQGGTTGWEDDVNGDADGENRSFVIPASDTTLHWQLFGNSLAASGEEQITSTILFGVDLTPLEDIGIYDRGRGDTLQVRGSFNGWGCGDPTACLLERIPGEDVFEAAIAITAFSDTEFEYKYFIEFNDETFMDAFDGQAPPGGWEEPISTTGANRKFNFEGIAGDQDLGIQFYNAVRPGNIVPEGTSIDVTFQVKMDSALVNDADPFNPATDSVTLNFGDAIWAFTQGLARADDGNFPTSTDNIVLEDGDGDGVYTGMMTITGPSYAAIQYKYAYQGDEAGTFTEEAGGGFGDVGRRRTRFVTPNADGSWPATWEFPVEEFQVTGNLPNEQNPVVTSVEQIDSEVPTTAFLGENYPNPFNPTTNIEYSITATEHVKLTVYDVTGRLVTTLVDGVLAPATYRVSFEANDLASGVYLYRLQAGNTLITKKMMLLK